MVNISNNARGSIKLTSNNDTDVNANMNGNAQRAKSWAVGEGLIDGVDYSAKYYAEKAKESQEIAERSIQSEDNAHIWAEGTDEEVQALGGEHSSKGWVDYVIENAPTAEIEQTETGATITVTDIHGTTTANILNGAKGNKGDKGDKGDTGAKGNKGDTGNTGNGIDKITKTSTSGLVDTYSIYFTTPGYTPATFTVTNGANGTNGTNGVSVTGVELYSTSGLAKTYRMSFSNSNHFDYVVTDGASGATTWGGISGTLSNQTDLQNALNAKYDATNPNGYTSNIGTVTSVNNTQPDANGNVTIQTGGTVDQTYDGTSANAQSGVAIAGAKFLQNEATRSGSSIILQGLTKNRPYAIGIGINNSATDYCTVVGATATTTGNYSTSIGYYARTSSTYATALGNGTYANAQYSLAVGSGATTSQTNAMAVGTGSLASGTRATALGAGATASGNYAIQLGYGTNDTANTFNVGFWNSTNTHYNWQLLDGATGLIPDARISSNIARTSAIPTVNNPTITFTQGGTTKGTITLNQSTNQTIAFDAGGGGTVDQTFDSTSANAQSGVAIEGELANYVEKNVGTTAIVNDGTYIDCSYEDDDYHSDLYINDSGLFISYEDYNDSYNSLINVSSNGILLGYTNSNGGVIITDDIDEVVLTVSNSNLAVNGSEVVTGDNTRFDGQWVNVDQAIISSATSLNSSTNLTYRVDLPNDEHKYEVMIRGVGYTNSTAGNEIWLTITGNEDSQSRYIGRARAAQAGTFVCCGTVICTMSYVASNAKNLTLARDTTWKGSCSELKVIAYRRIGTNT